MRTVLILVAACSAAPLAAQRPELPPRAAGGQIGDTTFRPAVGTPAYAPGAGPVVLLDEAHHNFHTVAGRYAAFAWLLGQDGFVVRPNPTPFTAAALRSARVVVIANALAERNAGGDWSLPTPSAFTNAEIEALRQWVEQGGSLFLIADHMPFPGAAEALAAAFGFGFRNGFAADSSATTNEFGFRRSDGSLADHPVTRGRSAAERVDSVRSFTGQAFTIPAAAVSLLSVHPGGFNLLPEVAWQFSESTPRESTDGMSQGAVLRYGRGRLAVFGEAAMFTAQISGAARRPMGMNTPRADRNPQFLLNLMHWLAGLL